MDDYSKYPESLGELKSDKKQDATLWSPRDVLINTLRDLDKGIINTDTLMVAWIQKSEENKEESKCSITYKDRFRIFGLVSSISHWLANG